MLWQGDSAGIGNLLRENGYPDDEDFVAGVSLRAEDHPDCDWHNLVDHLLDAAFQLQRSDIQMNLSVALTLAGMLNKDQQQVDAAKHAAHAEYALQMEELNQRAGQIAAARRGDA